MIIVESLLPRLTYRLDPKGFHITNLVVVLVVHL